jgi:hypothetical protein
LVASSSSAVLEIVTVFPSPIRLEICGGEGWHGESDIVCGPPLSTLLVGADSLGESPVAGWWVTEKRQGEADIVLVVADSLGNRGL